MAFVCTYTNSLSLLVFQRFTLIHLKRNMKIILFTFFGGQNGFEKEVKNPERRALDRVGRADGGRLWPAGGTGALVDRIWFNRAQIRVAGEEMY